LHLKNPRKRALLRNFGLSVVKKGKLLDLEKKWVFRSRPRKTLGGANGKKTRPTGGKNVRESTRGEVRTDQGEKKQK